MKEFKSIAILATIVLITFLCLYLSNYDFSNNISRDNNAIPENIEVAAINDTLGNRDDSTPLIKAMEKALSDSRQITKYEFYNYDNGVTSITFNIGEAESMGSLHVNTNGCTTVYDYQFKNFESYIEAERMFGTCGSTGKDSIHIYYDIRRLELRADFDGIRREFTTIKRDVNSVRENLSGDYVVDVSWEQTNGRKWESIAFFEKISVKASTDGKLEIIGFDFLEEFSSEQAPLQNIEGYNSAFIDDPTFIKTFYDDKGVENYVFKGTMYFNGDRDNFSFTTNYVVMVKDGAIMGLRLNRGHTSREFMFRLTVL